jgi:chromosome segregation ATPase
MTEDKMERTVSEAQPKRPSVWRRALAVGLRLLIVVLVGIGLGAGAYWGLPAAYRDFIEPVRQNTLRLDQAESDLADIRTSQRSASATQLADLADIQGRVAQQGEALSAMQADVGSLQASQPTLSAGMRTLDQLSSEMGDLSAGATQVAGQIEALNAAGATPDPTAQALYQRVNTLRLMQLVTQAKLSMTEGNLGQAAADLESASAALSELANTATTEDQAALNDVATRLSLAQQELKNSPSVAADDLDIVWQLLVELSRVQ